MESCPECRQANPEGAQFCSTCGAALSEGAWLGDGSSQQTRKTVTVIFCDVTGSTALGERLDPESLRAVLSRYFAASRRIIEHHGGTVEKFIGDAVMAVFGVPLVHEDDALRAVRSAWEMVENLTSLNEELDRDYGTTLQLRIGVDTGEVVTGTEERLATGDTLNVAARLEQSAEPGEILIGERTLRLTHNAVEVVPVGPLTLKGKHLPVPAYRLVGVLADRDVARRLQGHMVGRRDELQRLRTALGDVERDRVCRVFTVVGTAGAGKSRLTRELLTSVDGATVIQGRCLSYGEGSTYWPLVEALTPLLPRMPTLDLDPIAKTTIDRLLDGGAVAGDEIAWAFRKLVEGLAAGPSVIALFDDIQWADESLLALIEHMALVSREAPILLLCLARPDLLEKRPAWRADMRLEPLPADDVERLIEQCLGGADIGALAKERIRSSSGGNPLFVEEMTAVVQASGGVEFSLPPTIQALLAARIDQLPPAERRLLSRAAVEGEVFHRGALQALLPEERSLTSQLTALVRKDLLVPHPAQLAGEDGFRFRHLLIRDAAYDSTPKATRAVLHETFAEWLGGKMSERLVEAEAIIGHHYEQAYRYRVSLGPVDAHSRVLRVKAGELLATAASRTLARGGAGAAVSLFERATTLMTVDDPERLVLLPRLGHALKRKGELQRALGVLEDAIEAGNAAGNEAVSLRARIELARILSDTNPKQAANELLSEGQAAIPVLERLGDDEGLALAWQGIAEGCNLAMRYEAMAEALIQARAHARRRFGNDALVIDAETWLIVAWVLGPTPANEMARLGAEMGEGVQPTPRRESWRMILIAYAAMLLGHSEESRELFARSHALVEGMEAYEEGASAFMYQAGAALDVGAALTAENEARSAYEILERAGAMSSSASAAGMLAHALYERGQDEEALRFAEISRHGSSSADLFNESLWRRARAKILARRGDIDEALVFAHEAVAVTEPTDALNEKAGAQFDLADVLHQAGNGEESRQALERALELYEQKGNVVRAASVRAVLANSTGPPG